MRCHILGDFGTVGETLHNFLHLPWPDEPRLVKGEVMLDQGLDTLGHGYHPLLGLFAVRATLPQDSERFLLPENLLWRESTELGHPQTSVEEGPDNEFFFGGCTGVRQRIGLLGS